MGKNKKSKASSSGGAKAAALNDSMNMLEKFSHVFVISMFTLFPVFMTDKLFNVRMDRLYYFIVSTLILLFFIIATYICEIDKDRWPKKIYKFTVTDYAMVAFLLICALSAAFSEYGMEAVTGSGGRNSGLLLMAVYVLCYFLLSRYYKCKTYVFDIFIITSCLISIVAVLNEFYVDPLGVFTYIKEEQQDTFITTIGNKNLYSAFLCVCIPVIVVLLVRAKGAALTAFYSIACGISFMGMLVADSDSGYFGLAVLMLMLLIYACGTADRMYKYFLALFSMAFSCKVLRFISFVFEDKMKALDTIPNTLIFNNKVYIVIAAIAVVTAGFFFLSKKFGETHSPKWVRAIVIIFVVLCMLAVLVPFIYFSFIDTTTDLGSLEKYLRLNDKWGTHRGYAWIRSITLFKSNGVKNMLIGCGPDTFGQIMKEHYRADMIKRHGSVFDSAHNEYLNYLVTVGILGLAAYVTALASVIVRGAKRCKDSLPLLVIVFAIVTYCAQAVFNLATPITTPYLFVFLGMGESIIRRKEMAEKEQLSSAGSK